MACDPQVLRQVPLFALLDDEETAVLASQVELKQFPARHRIYKMGDAGGRAYVMVSGRVRVTTLDEDHQEVVVDQPAHGEFFGFASMLDQTPHQYAIRSKQQRLSWKVRVLTPVMACPLLLQLLQLPPFDRDRAMKRKNASTRVAIMEIRPGRFKR